MPNELLISYRKVGGKASSVYKLYTAAYSAK